MIFIIFGKGDEEDNKSDKQLRNQTY